MTSFQENNAVILEMESPQEANKVAISDVAPPRAEKVVIRNQAPRRLKKLTLSGIVCSQHAKKIVITVQKVPKSFQNLLNKAKPAEEKPCWYQSFIRALLVCNIFFVFMLIAGMCLQKELSLEPDENHLLDYIMLTGFSLTLTTAVTAIAAVQGSRNNTCWTLTHAMFSIAAGTMVLAYLIHFSNTYIEKTLYKSCEIFVKDCNISMNDEIREFLDTATVGIQTGCKSEIHMLLGLCVVVCCFMNSALVTANLTIKMVPKPITKKQCPIHKHRTAKKEGIAKKEGKKEKKEGNKEGATKKHGSKNLTKFVEQVNILTKVFTYFSFAVQSTMIILFFFMIMAVHNSSYTPDLVTNSTCADFIDKYCN